MPPERVGRRGVYHEAHRERLVLIARLQGRGYSLAGIKDLLDAWDEGSSLAAVLEHRGMTETAFDEMPVAMSTDTLAATVPGLDGAEALAAAVDARLVTRVDDHYVARSAALVHLVADAVHHGAALDSVLATIATVRAAARAQGEAFATLFINELWDPDAPPEAIDALARRSRLQIAQAASSLIVDELAAALERATHREGGQGLHELLNRIRVGSIQSTNEGGP